MSGASWSADLLDRLEFYWGVPGGPTSCDCWWPTAPISPSWDDQFHATPADWAEFFGHPDVAAHLRAAAQEHR